LHMILSLTLPTLFLPPATPPTELYTLSLHDALPIWKQTSAFHNTPDSWADSFSVQLRGFCHTGRQPAVIQRTPYPYRQSAHPDQDRKSTRLNSSHVSISYAVFCLKKKKNRNEHLYTL